MTTENGHRTVDGYPLPDGRCIRVYSIGSEYAVVMLTDTDAEPIIKEYHQSLANAHEAAASWARGIKFDLMWRERERRNGPEWKSV